MHRNLFLLFVAAQLLVANSFAENKPTPTAPVAEEPSEVSVIGTLEGGFQVFPVAQVSNSLYKQKKRVFSQPGLIVRGALEAKQGTFVWGDDEEGKRQGHWLSEGGGEVESFGDNIFVVSLPAGLSRVFWVGPKGEMADLLPYSNTAANVAVNGAKLGAFTHISGGEQIKTDAGKTAYQYSFKLHSVNLNTGKVTHYRKAYTALSSTLKLKWVRANLLQVIGNGVDPVRVTIR